MAGSFGKSRTTGAASRASILNVDPFREETSKGIKDDFWEFAPAKELRPRWNQLYPFELVVLTRKEGNWFTDGDRFNDLDATFSLPIPPQAMTISTPFAISTSVTMGGIVEEHNGAPLRTITLQGTMGVFPLKGRTEERKASLGGGVFAGTVNAAAGLGNAATGLGNAITTLTGGSVDATQANLNADDVFEPDATGGAGTGYMQMLLLQRFLEAYINLKKTSAGKDRALAFCIWKEQAVYLVTPVNFDVVRSAQAPLEYTYNLSFKAWKRIALTNVSKQPIGTYKAPAQSPSKMAQILNTIQAARRVLEKTQSLLKAVIGDIEFAVLTPIRQTVLLLKDGLGVASTAADMPFDLVKDMQEPILEAFNTKFDTSSFQDRDLFAGGNSTDDKIKQSVEELSKLAVEKNKGKIGSASFIGLPREKPTNKKAAPAHRLFDESGNHFDLFDKVKIGDLNLRPHTVRKIAEEKRRVRNLKRDDFEKARDSILKSMNDFCNAIGAGSGTYNRLNGTPSTGTIRAATDDDWEIIFSMSQAAQGFDALAASATINKGEIDTVSYIAGLASRSGIAFKIPTSKFLVPFLYGHTLEQLAARYLGDPDRWMEIAALNGLQEPYIDEIGFSARTLANGNGNQITVADGSSYFVNQPIWIRSLNQREEQRRIIKVDTLSPALTVLTLSGDADLEKYTTLAQTVVNAFLPNTVNSRQLIYIPSDEPTDDRDFRTNDIPGVDYFDPLIRSGGIDLMLDANGDLVITPDGTTRLAVGLTNLIQRVRIAFGTLQGSLIRHPSFGLGVKPGTSTADVSAQELLQQAKAMFRDDPAFAGIDYAAVKKDGNSVKMTVAVRLSGTQKTIPITVDVRR